MGKRLIAIMLVLAAGMPAARSIWLLCQDGMLHSTCCCASAEQQVANVDETARPPQLQAASCCVLTEVEQHLLVTGPGLGGFHLSPPALDAAPRVTPPAPRATLFPPVSSPQVENALLTSRGPPRFLTKCTWLI